MRRTHFEPREPVDGDLPFDADELDDEAGASFEPREESVERSRGCDEPPPVEPRPYVEAFGRPNELAAEACGPRLVVPASSASMRFTFLIARARNSSGKYDCRSMTSSNASHIFQLPDVSDV